MSQQPNITRFPTSKSERRRILRRSQDARLRLVAVCKPLTGWLFAIITLVFIASQYQMFMPENLRRIANYAQIGLGTASGDSAVINYPTGSAKATALFDDGLAIADSDTLYIMRPGDMLQLSEQTAYQGVALDAAKDRVLAYDRGGYGITVTSGAAQVLQMELECPIQAASLCQDGSFVVITDEQGYKSAVTVFDHEGRQSYKWSSSEYYIQAAALSPSGKYLAALVFQPKGIALEGKALFYAVGREEAASEVSLGTSYGFAVEFISEDAAAVISDTGAYVLHRNGKTLAQLAYATDDLIGFCFGGGKAAIASRSFSAGYRAAITLLSEKGISQESLQIAEELQSMALTDGLLGVLTSSNLHFYDHTLLPLRTTDQAVGGKQLLLQEDGIAYVLFSKQARLFTVGQTEAVARDN